MTTHDQRSAISAARKRRTYSAEFKQRIVQACKEPDTSIASVVLQYGLNANLVFKWIRLMDGEQAVQPSKFSKPVFIALPYPETLDPVSKSMLTVGITLAHSYDELFCTLLYRKKHYPKIHIRV